MARTPPPGDRRPALAHSAVDVCPAEDERVVDTLFGLWLLRTCFPARRGVWRRAAAKAARWLRDTLRCTPDALEQLLDSPRA